MREVIWQPLTRRRGSARRACLFFYALGVSLLLASCAIPEPRSGSTRPPDPGRPQPACPAGVRPIGVLVVLSNTVFRNSRPAVSGERVCDGDSITTNASGVGEVLPDNDRQSDAVHIAEGTDPRFTWTRGGCLSVDRYNAGRIVATSRRHCIVVRTPDTLMLVVSGRVQLQVVPKTSTEVVPIRGSVTKLQPMTEQQIQAYSPAQLRQRAAAPALQPHVHSLNVYRNYSVLRPAVRLPPAEIRRLDSSALRRAPDILR